MTAKKDFNDFERPLVQKFFDSGSGLFGIHQIISKAAYADYLRQRVLDID